MILRSFLLNYTIIFFFVPKLNTALYFQAFFFIFEIVSYAGQVGLKLTLFEITLNFWFKCWNSSNVPILSNTGDGGRITNWTTVHHSDQRLPNILHIANEAIRCTIRLRKQPFPGSQSRSQLSLWGDAHCFYPSSRVCLPFPNVHMPALAGEAFSLVWNDSSLS